MINSQLKNRTIWWLFIGSCLLYAMSLGHQFVLDDALVLTENRFVKQMDFWSILTKDTFAGFFQSENTSQFVAGGRYRPLTLLIFSVIYSITQSPWVFHVLNVLAFAATVVVVYRLTEQFNFKHAQQQQRLALFTAILFAVHPIHTEVVNNIKGLDDILSLLLALIAWLILLKTPKPPAIKQFAGLFCLMFLALMSKESAIVIVPLAAVSLWFFQNNSVWLSLKRCAPFIVASLLYVLIRAVVIHSAADIQIMPELMNDPFLQWHQGAWEPLSIANKYGTIFHTLGLYLHQVLLPIKLSHDYYPHAIPVTGLCNWQSVLSMLLYSGMAFYCLYGLLKKQLPAFAILIYLVSLALFSNVFFTIGTLMAERFLYMPSLGICLLMAWCFIVLSQKIKNRKIALILLSAVAVSTLIAACWQTLLRSQDWHNNLTLFKADISKSTNSAKLNTALGGELIAQWQARQTNNNETIQLEIALNYLNHAIELHPTYAQAYLLKGNALHYLGRTNDAIKTYHQALTFKPNFSAAKDNLARVDAQRKQVIDQERLQNMAEQAIAHSQQGNHDQAIGLFTSILDEQATAQYYFFRGVAYGQSGQAKLALSDFKQAEVLTDPNDHENLLRLWQAIKSASLETGDTAQANDYQKKIDNILSTRSK